MIYMSNDKSKKISLIYNIRKYFINEMWEKEIATRKE